MTVAKKDLSKASLTFSLAEKFSSIAVKQIPDDKLCESCLKKEFETSVDCPDLGVDYENKVYKINVCRECAKEMANELDEITD